MADSKDYIDAKFIACESWSTAIKNLTDADQKYSVEDGNYSSLAWHEDNTKTKPTEGEIEAELTRLVGIWNSTEEPRIKRKEEYPSIVDQLDKIYHEGIDAWKVDIKAIKDKYPKS